MATSVYGSKGDLPSSIVSSYKDLVLNNRFVVTLGPHTYGFQEVSGIEYSNNYNTFNEGGVNDHEIQIGMTPFRSNGKLTLQRGMVKVSSLLASTAVEGARMAAAFIPNNILRKTTLMAVNSLDTISNLKYGPTLGIIEIYDRNKVLHSMFQFLSLGLASWSIGNLDALSGSIIIEEISLNYIDLRRVPVYNGSIGDFLVPINWQYDDNDVDKVKQSEEDSEEDEAKKFRENLDKTAKDQQKADKEKEEDKAKNLREDLDTEARKQQKADKEKEVDKAKNLREDLDTKAREKQKADKEKEEDKAKEIREKLNAKSDEQKVKDAEIRDAKAEDDAINAAIAGSI